MHAAKFGCILVHSTYPGKRLILVREALCFRFLAKPRPWGKFDEKLRVSTHLNEHQVGLEKGQPKAQAAPK
jgi:hypothetical protein